MPTGSYTHNTCTPRIAREGTFATSAASVWLGYPVQTGAGEEFSTVRYTYADPSVPGGWATFTALLETSPG